MAQYYQPLTQLEAVNICLSSMGEPSVNALEDSGVDAQIAADLIEETSRFVQLRGWHWNRESHNLSPDVDGNINLPQHVAKVDTVSADYGIDVVQRGLRLYNRSDNTHIFTKPICLELYVILDYDELPLAAKSFIAYDAAMTFQQRMLGDDTIDKKLSEKRDVAWVELIRDNDEVQDANFLKDNWSTMSILTRGGFRRGAYL